MGIGWCGSGGVWCDYVGEYWNCCVVVWCGGGGCG